MRTSTPPGLIHTIMQVSCKCSRFSCLILSIVVSFSLVSCQKPDKPIRIFDVHLHGSPEPDDQLQKLKAAGVYKAAVSSSWDLQQSYVSSDPLEIYQGLMVPCPEGKVPYSLQTCFENGNEWPPVDWVDDLMKRGKIHFLGEILAQYHGISSSDTMLFPYYRLAEKYNVPVGVHTGSAGPDHGCPNFKEELGSPLLLESTLKAFPTLRVWIMHAGGPYLDETIRLMKQYPHVYADISAINNPEILKPEIFAATMQRFIDQGLGDRLMFGSDNGPIESMINSITSLTFLTPDQRDRILFKNAEVFFSRNVNK